MRTAYFRKQIFLPQDHGAWVFIFSPLLIGLFLGGNFTFASLSLTVASMTAFLLRQPLTIAIKVHAGRRPITDMPMAIFWIVVYGLIALLALIVLVGAGFGYLLYLAIPGIPVFGWHLWLVSRREERRQINVEIVATGVLSLAAPAAYWVGVGHYDPVGWWLWILVWLQTSASIVYAYLRLGQRELSEVPARNDLWGMGSRAFAYVTFNLLFTVTLGLASVLPRFVFLPFLVQWIETMWGIFHPAIKWKPVRIGTRQLIVSILWTILFIITWRS
jgi:hypothetical protein